MTASGVAFTTRALTRMIQGERLTLSDLLKEPGAPQRAALRRRMRDLVDNLPWARRAGTRGKPEEYWWEGPSTQPAPQASPTGLVGSTVECDIGTPDNPDAHVSHRGIVVVVAATQDYQGHPTLIAAVDDEITKGLILWPISQVCGQFTRIALCTKSTESS